MFGLSTKSRGSDGGRSRERARRHVSPRVHPGLEAIESRDLKTGAITFNIDTVTIDGLAVGTRAKVVLDGRDWWNPFDDLVRVSLTDIQTNPLIEQKAFPAGDVHRVMFNGGDGTEVFEKEN